MSDQNFNLEQYLEELKALINVDCGTWTPAGVSKIADIMTEKYQSLGWQVTRHTFDEKVGPGLLATNKPEAEEYDIMLIGHLDTVFPEGTVAEWSLTQDYLLVTNPNLGLFFYETNQDHDSITSSTMV